MRDAAVSTCTLINVTPLSELPRKVCGSLASFLPYQNKYYCMVSGLFIFLEACQDVAIPEHSKIYSRCSTVPFPKMSRALNLNWIQYMNSVASNQLQYRISRDIFIYFWEKDYDCQMLVAALLYLTYIIPRPSYIEYPISRNQVTVITQVPVAFPRTAAHLFTSNLSKTTCSLLLVHTSTKAASFTPRVRT